MSGRYNPHTETRSARFASLSIAQSQLLHSLLTSAPFHHARRLKQHPLRNITRFQSYMIIGEMKEFLKIALYALTNLKIVLSPISQASKLKSALIHISWLHAIIFVPCND